MRFRFAPPILLSRHRIARNVPQNRFASFAERARLAAAVPLVALRHRGTTAMRNAGMPFRFTPCHTVTSHQPRALYEIHVFLLGLSPQLLKRIQFCFSFIIEGKYGVFFAPLRKHSFYKGNRRCFLRFAPETVYLLGGNEYNGNR